MSQQFSKKDKAGSGATSLDKAFELCEVLSSSPAGVTLGDLARVARLPRPTAHRLLAVLKRRGYVRQDEETGRYGLTLKMLDLSFRLLGRSELRLHAYPVLRDYVLRSGERGFIAMPPVGEVTYIWSTGPDAVAMHTVYAKEMPGHCAIYFDATQVTRRLSCLRLSTVLDVTRAETGVQRLGTFLPPGDGGQRLSCTCAPVHDYTGREVARVGLFGHGADDSTLVRTTSRDAWELARLISIRLGYLAAATMPVTA